MNYLRWQLFLIRAFGQRVLLGYGALTFAAVAILVALYFSSLYGLQGYVRDQVARVPWDVTLLQRGEVHKADELQEELNLVEHVNAAEVAGFLRVRNASPIRVELDGEEVPVRWLTFLSTSTQGVLPPSLDVAAGLPEGDISLFIAGAQGRAIEDQLSGVGEGSRLEIFEAREEDNHGHGGAAASAPGRLEHGDEHGHESPALFEGHIRGSPVRIVRQEVNQWMLREAGFLSYLPDQALLIPVPLNEFNRLSALFQRLYFSHEGAHGGDVAPPYVPQVTHLLSLDRDALVSSWDLGSSAARLGSVRDEVYEAGWWLTPFVNVRGDLQSILQRMDEISNSLGALSLLVALPLLWMAWVIAGSMASLMLLNERRRLGLALIRGIPLRELERAMFLSILLGGVLGGVLGLLFGAGIPIMAYASAGLPAPPGDFLLERVPFFAGFFVAGLVFAVISGWRVFSYVRRLSPREATARVEQNEESALAASLSPVYLASVIIALALASYKIVAWITGSRALTRWVVSLLPETYTATVVILDNALNIVVIPLFLYGIAGLMLWRAGWIQNGLGSLTVPLLGPLHWFGRRQMVIGRHRIISLLFVAALALSLSLMPRIAADSFDGRVARGIRASLGADLLMEFDMVELGSDPDLQSIAAHRDLLSGGDQEAVRQEMLSAEGIRGVEVLQQFFLPDVYIPGQSGLALNLLEDPRGYLNTVYYDDSLGITGPFEEVIGSASRSSVVSSAGLFQRRRIPPGGQLTLGYDSGGETHGAGLGGIVSFLPGQPSTGVQQRESFVAAEVNYMNYLLQSDARIITTTENIERSGLAGIEVTPSRVMFLVDVAEGYSVADIAAELGDSLPIRPLDIRFEALENELVSRDMFISLALENLRVYTIGGVLLALAGVVAIGLANFLATRRTFGLLRIRGVPRKIVLRICLSLFLIPIAAGVIIGIFLGTSAGYGIEQIVWDLPRVRGVAGSLPGQLVLSGGAWGIVSALTLVFSFMAVFFGFWLFRQTARESVTER